MFSKHLNFFFKAHIILIIYLIVCVLLNVCFPSQNWQEMSLLFPLESFAHWVSTYFCCSLSHLWLFATPWTAAHQASLSFTSSWSLLKPMSIELMMSSNHLILGCPLLLLPSIFPSSRVFSNESALHIRLHKHLYLYLIHIYESILCLPLHLCL